jgi:hypothetical protein
MSVTAKHFENLAPYRPAAPLAMRTPTYKWVERLHFTAETLATTEPNLMSALSVTARRETASPEEVECLAEVAQTVADVYGLCATITVQPTSPSFSVRFCRCPSYLGPHPRSECR